MARKLHSSLILVAVFGLGIAAGVGAVYWAWPALQAKFFPHKRETNIQYMTRTLDLTPSQVPQVKAILDETRQRSHDLHSQFVPSYAKICDDFTAVRKQERDAFAPVQQQQLQKLQTALTPEQWQKLEAMRAKNPPPQRPPDVCRHLYPNGGGPGGASGPNGGPNGPGGRGGRGGRGGPGDHSHGFDY